MKSLHELPGQNDENEELRNAWEAMSMALENEQFQVDVMTHPAIRDKIRNGPAYDKDPDGTGPFGYVETNPIPVNGPIGQLAYLSKLETAAGERILFHRIGAVNKIDVFEAVTFSGSEWYVLFLDLYHPQRSRLTPETFRFTTEIPLFSGFHVFCNDFPYDFAEMRQTTNRSGLIDLYITVGEIAEALQNRSFERSVAHKTRLDLIESRLTSSQGMLKPTNSDDS